MPKLSKEKIDKISEQILNYLFTISPDSAFTNKIGNEIARDEEFTKSILQDLTKKKLVAEVNKNKNGIDYLKRQRWRLSNQAFDVYQKRQFTQNTQISSKLQQSL